MFSAEPVAGKGEMREALAFAPEKIARDLLVPAKAEDASLPDILEQVVGDQRGARAFDHRDGAAAAGISHEITGRNDIAQIRPPANISPHFGAFSMTFSHYEEMPQHLAQKVIDEYQRAREEAHKK